MRISTCSLILGLAITGAAPGQTPLELIPQDAAASIAINDLDALIKKGDKFLTDSAIRMPIRPSQLFDMGTQFLGINRGLDRKAPAAILLLSPENDVDYKGLDFLRYLVPVLPFTDADMMAENFGIANGKLKPKEILRTDREGNDRLTNYAAREKNHIYLSSSENTLRRIQKSKPVAATLSPGQRKLFDDADVLLHFGRFLWKHEENSLARDLGKKLSAGDDPREKELAEQFVASLLEVQDGLLSFRLHEGLDSHFLLTVPKDGRAAKLFKTLKDNRPASHLKGLPEGNVLMAQASAGDAAQQAILTKALFNFMLEEILINKKFVHHVDRLTYLGVFHEVWRRLQGNRLAVYQNVDEKKLGLFSAVAIFDTQDAKVFVRDMRTLMKMAVADSLDLTRKEVKEEIDIDRLVRDLKSSVYAIRQSANTKLALIGEPVLPNLTKAIDSDLFDLEGKRRARELRDRINAVAAQRRKELLGEKNQPLFVRPKLTFIAAAEKRHELSVDVINIKLAGLEKVAAHQYTQLLGPDWDKVRLAIVGNQIVVMLGSDTALFDAALRNVKNGNTGLASSKRLAVFHDRAAKDRMLEFHVSVEGVLRLISPNAKHDTPLQMTSMALTLGASSLQVDVRVPTPEVRAMARKAQEGMQ